MNINQLQYFQVTCKYENISKAAQVLHVSQSAVSKSIRELEKEFEVNLFNRYNNSLVLTSDGKNFLNQAEKILNEVQQLYISTRDLNHKNKIIRFGVSPIVGSCLLPPFYQELQEFDNSLILDLAELHTNAILQEIENENLDLGLIAANDIDLSRINHIHLLNVSLVFCVHQNNPLSQAAAISFDMLQHEPLVLLRPDSVENQLLLDRFRSSSVSPNIIFFSDQVYTIQHMINHELASSFLYDIIVPRNQEIKHIPLEEPIVLNIALVWKKDRYLHSGAKKVIECSKHFTFSHYHG